MLSVKPSEQKIGRGRIYNNILETVGNTPLVRLNKLPREHNCAAAVFAKLEYFNPVSSVKDRIAVAMIEQSELSGQINSQTTIIEATSGNTGIGLAFVCAVKNYRLILVMPETVTSERKLMLAHLGAEIILTPKEQGVIGSIEHAHKLAKSMPNAWMVDQDHHPANLAIHQNTTAMEIWNDTNGEVDVIVAGVGTSGTLSGIASRLKELKPSVKVVAVEPASSPVLTHGDSAAGQHKIIGIGAFTPEFYQTALVDQVISVSNEEAISTAQKLAREEGIISGISGGASIFAALKYGQQSSAIGKNIIAIVASSAERYFSSELFDAVRN
jgi:cysteine synthase A